MRPKVLVVRFSSIGDIVVCTSVIRMLVKQHNAEVHLLTKEKFKFVLEDNPYISKIITINKKVKEVKKVLKKEDYDFIVDLHKNIRSSTVKALLRKPVYTFDKLNVARNLFIKTKINILPRKHIVDRHIEGLAPILTNDGKGLDYFIDESKLPKEILNFKKLNYVVLSLGATHYTKRITPKVLNSFCENIDEQIIVIGGKDTIELSNAITPKTNILNLTGKTSMASSAYLAKHAQYVITGDSAIMHISAALQKKMIVVWGATSPLLGMAPYYGNTNQKKYIELYKNLSCRPCTKQGTASCPKQHFNCMDYTKEEVTNAIKMVEDL